MAKERLAFIVRLWTETETGKKISPVWRGSLELVGAKQLHYFNSVDEISTMIQVIMNDPDIRRKIKE